MRTLSDETSIVTWDSARHTFHDEDNPPPALLAWAATDRAEPSPPPVSRLEAFAAGEAPAISAAELFCEVHLCAERGETRAYPALCRLIAEDSRIADWLDDAVTETLPGILIRTYDGDPEPLRRAIESADGDEFARAAALAALAYLVREREAMSDADMQVFLRRLRREAAPRRESVLWLTWASVVASLGYETMRFEVAQLGRDGRIPEGGFSRAEFDLRLDLARSHPSGLGGFRYDRIEPLRDAGSAIRSLVGRDGAGLCALAWNGESGW